jgi:hypothetical protein
MEGFLAALGAASFVFALMGVLGVIKPLKSWPFRTRGQGASVFLVSFIGFLVAAGWAGQLHKEQQQSAERSGGTAAKSQSPAASSPAVPHIKTTDSESSQKKEASATARFCTVADSYPAERRTIYSTAPIFNENALDRERRDAQKRSLFDRNQAEMRELLTGEIRDLDVSFKSLDVAKSSIKLQFSVSCRDAGYQIIASVNRDQDPVTVSLLASLKPNSKISLSGKIIDTADRPYDEERWSHTPVYVALEILQISIDGVLVESSSQTRTQSCASLPNWFLTETRRD